MEYAEAKSKKERAKEARKRAEQKSALKKKVREDKKIFQPGKKK
jgi:hypothetical protein